ncbi:beta-glucoside-specific PTS transporter subunit IIABC [Kineothrix sp. MB12-C1]|uniref:beta-glucoside-specific PTS transporter subunit IIABC n=1 Tax=Kineothrix sp. MB12-C1 TaxID=3070215 RepID=UPI0027D2296F|nr:beta-glucoside-specific PTS transporter subunit IIABC [Kineothrix sp. MB12-C1]WMC91882.1 beta-glucoside-specific PTS transporter subunit IIABC [Kineothrix sp. MB12-C1]
MNYNQLAADILELVGGERNVLSVTNCMTRLRFQLRDTKLANVEAIKNLKGVQGIVTKNGQFQIIIGTDVSNVCDELKKMGSFPESTTGNEEEKKGILAAFFGTLTAIFTPVIPALAGSGMIKALLALLVAFKVVEAGSGTYQLFTAFGDALFYFLPFILAVSAAKQFKCSPYIAAVLAGVLMHASVGSLEPATAALSIFNGNVINFNYVTMFGFLPMLKVSYGGSVIPILLIVWVQSKIEPWANKISPNALKIFLAPMITIIGTGIIGLFVAGPLGNLVGNILAIVFNFFNDYAGWVIPLLMGTFCPFFVMTGMHYCFAPIQTIQYATLGYGTILGPGMLASNIAQGTASLTVGLRTKNKDMKQIAYSAGFTGLMGITEPALYGVNLKLKRPLYAAMIGGGVAGLYAGITGIHTFSSTTAGLLALPVYIGGDSIMNVVNAIITIIISIVVTAIATLILGFVDPIEEKTTKETGGNSGKGKADRLSVKETIGSPLKGKVVSLEQIPDEVFSKGILGQGIAVIPSEGKVTAPCDATVVSVIDSKHAVGLQDVNGTEILIHVGLDTVGLKGEHFECLVTEGQQVRKGQTILIFDMDEIKKAGYQLITPIIISNTDDYLEVIAADTKQVNYGDGIITIIR